MKAIVIACKNITEEAEHQERNSNMPIYEKDRLAVQKNKLSTALQALMAATKNHATNFGSVPVSAIENCVSNLSQTIYDLLDIVAPRQTPRSRSNSGQGENIELDELRVYLEKQTDSIVQAIQSLLFAMRSSDSFDFEDTVQGITQIVENLVVVSQKTLQRTTAAHLRRDGEASLHDLSDANERLSELGRSVNESQSKQLKQKLAGSSYEIAKVLFIYMCVY
jgi:hypothetical protein